MVETREDSVTKDAVCNSAFYLFFFFSLDICSLNLFSKIQSNGIVFYHLELISNVERFHFTWRYLVNHITIIMNSMQFK